LIEGEISEIAPLTLRRFKKTWQAGEVISDSQDIKPEALQWFPTGSTLLILQRGSNDWNTRLFLPQF
jgi:hypothetical protein